MDKFRLWLGERLAGYREWIEGRNRAHFELAMLACVIVGVTVIVGTAYLPGGGGFVAGEPAPRSVTATDSVMVVDSEATEALREDVAALVEPVYVSDPQATDQAIAELESFFTAVDQARATVIQDEASAEASIQQAADSLRPMAPPTVSDSTLIYLLTTDTGEYEVLRTQAVGALRAAFTNTITEDSLDAARARLRDIVDTLAGSAGIAGVLYEVTGGFVRPNTVVDEQQTLIRKQAAAEQVAPVTVAVQEGEQVAVEGEVVSVQDMLVLQALGEAQGRSGWKIWLGIFFIAFLEAVAFSRLLHRFNKTTGLQNLMRLALVTLLLLFTLIARLLIISPLSAYLIPVAAIGMVVTIILNARSAFLMVVLLSLNVGLLTDLDMRYSLVAIIAGAFSVYLVTRVAQRVALLGAGAATAVLAAFAIFSVELFRETGTGEALRLSTWGLAHGFLAWVLTMLLLLILDTVFNLNTPLRLLELGNPAHPLLKRLLQVAPGTYNHSMQMGNMAEAAAEVIDADVLLARVGAYYHDIGKTIRPEYFVENQKERNVDNPHDRLSPNLSKLALAAHVRDGEHLAKLYGLPAPVVDIIRQHHGTTVMKFFYNKAQQSSKVRVEEEDYRYEEEKPRTKEAAIVMLADGTEAAVRALLNPTRRKIHGVIQEVFKQRMEDGQLDESNLTLADLHRIEDSFEQSLRGIVGERIAYPEPDGQEAPSLVRFPETLASETLVDGLSPGVPEAPVPPPVTRPRVPPSAAALRAKRTSEAGSMGSAAAANSSTHPQPAVSHAAPRRRASRRAEAGSARATARAMQTQAATRDPAPQRHDLSRRGGGPDRYSLLSCRCGCARAGGLDRGGKPGVVQSRPGRRSGHGGPQSALPRRGRADRRALLPGG